MAVLFVVPLTVSNDTSASLFPVDVATYPNELGGISLFIWRFIFTTLSVK